MSTLLSEHSQTLTITTCWCGIRHAVPKSLYRQAQQNRQQVYCPLGHIWVIAGKTEAERERERRLELETRLREQREASHRIRQNLEHKVRGHKAANTRLRRRVAAGVCPCCNRTFQDLARHMAGQHPGFAGGDA